MTNPFEQKLARGERPSTHERLRMIFDILGKVEKAPTTAQEARDLLDRVFSLVENSTQEGAMSVGSFESMSAIHYHQHVVYYKIYLGHILFIGDNGAMEIWGKKENNINLTDIPIEDLKYPSDHMKPVFMKVGADKKGIIRE